MRIIDKNTDFYDYIQNMYPDDSLTFDRTDSFVLTKEIMCNHLVVRKNYSRYAQKKKITHYNFVLLQIGNAFWLFLVTITAIDEFDKPTDYTIELIKNWKNYDKPRVLERLDVISFNYGVTSQMYAGASYWSDGYDKAKILSKADVLIKAVDTNDYKVQNTVNRHTIYRGDNVSVEKHIPLFKACGIANCIEALDVFLAFEEYLSLEKSASERTSAIGTTNNDKIQNHGFDVKSSFRGTLPKQENRN